MTIGLVVPAYNAASTLPRLLAEAGQFVEPRDLLVVDDGSTDRTAAVCHAAGVEIQRHPCNRGKGAALQTGFRWAIQRGYPAVITLDADGQHDCRDIPRFIDAAVSEQADLVIGSRMDRPDGMPWARQLSNRLTSRIISWRVGQRIRDSQSGYRLIRTTVLQTVPLVTSRFQTESELLIKAALRGYRIRAIPIRSVYVSPASAIRPVIDTWRFVILLTRSLAW
ncbi:MAG: glycosyltransferase family 2 protein [Candidatus Latescibacteria bacterium]|nr:glycosyltransferase family 2 protein [Candidatus Latescibacterota bacterium]